MFFAVILVVWTGLHAYVFWRIASVPVIAGHLPRAAVLTIAAVLWASFILSRLIEFTPLHRLARMLEMAGANWIGILFLAFACLLAVDVVTGFGYFAPQLAPRLRAWALAASAVLSVIAFIQAARAPVVRSYQVELPNLPRAQDGAVMLVISDLHLGAMLDDSWLAERVAQINAQRPDILVLAGDIVEGHGGSERKLLPAMRRLSAPLGVWAVNGNHETYGRLGGDGGLLEDAGFHVLRDQWAEVRPGLVIAGVDDLTARRRRLGRASEYVDHALADRPAGAATIFVSHTPWFADRAAQQGVGLMVSGHTHNGQIWPFTYVVRMVYPMIAGEYQVAGMPLIVCRGTGTWGPRMRLWGRSEMLRITLRAPSARPAPIRSSAP